MGSLRIIKEEANKGNPGRLSTRNQEGSGSTDGRAIRNSDAMKLERADENRGLG